MSFGLPPLGAPNLVCSTGQLGNNPNLVSLLNNTTSETLDDLVRAGYLSQQHGSSNSLAGSLAASGNYGSASNLTNSGAFGSSTNLPSAANHGSAANLVGDSEFGSSSNLKGSSSNLAGLSGMTASASHGNLAGGLLPGAGLGDRMGPGGITPQQQVQVATVRPCCPPSSETTACLPLAPHLAPHQQIPH